MDDDILTYRDLYDPETCPHCSSEVYPVGVDEGIGCYEYWGSREVDVRWVKVCPECGGYIE